MQRITIALAALLATGPAFAERPEAGTQGRTSDRPEQMQDQRHGQMSAEKALNKMYKLNVNEIELAQLATDRAENPEVRQFAQRLRNDHEQSAQQVRQLAQQLGIRLEEPMGPDRRAAGVGGTQETERGVQVGEGQQGAPTGEHDRHHQTGDPQANEPIQPDMDRRTEERGAQVGEGDDTQHQTGDPQANDPMQPDMEGRPGTERREQERGARVGEDRGDPQGADRDRRRAQRDREHQQSVQRLERLSGAEFDREFVRVIEKKHEKSLETLREMRLSLDEDQVVQLIDQQLPTIQQHYEQAQQLRQQVEGSPS